MTKGPVTGELPSVLNSYWGTMFSSSGRRGPLARHQRPATTVSSALALRSSEYTVGVRSRKAGSPREILA